MKIQLPVASLTLAYSLVAASSINQQFKARDPHDEVDWSKHQWQAPTATDSRGPCPGLNTLANHGFLPRNGKNLTIPIVLQGALNGFNVHRELLNTAAKAALFTSDLDDQFELENISLHGNIEHDASLSREDHALGNNNVFNETIYSTLANSNPGSDFFNTTSAGQVQKARLEQSQARNPNLRNTIKEFQVRTRESALYLAVMGNPVTGIAPKKFVNIFFREERMPLEEGWRKPSTPVTGQTDGPLFGAIAKGSQWQPIAGQCPWVTLAQGAPEDPVNDGSIL